MYQAIPPASSLDPWQSTQQAFLKSLIPQITRFEYLKLGPTPIGATAAVTVVGDASKEGGGSQGITSNTTRYYTNTLFQTLNTGKWAVSWRGKIAAPVVARNANAGFTNAAGNHGVYIRTDNTVSTTKWFVQFVGAGTDNNLTGTADNSNHTFSLTGDATSITMYVDNVISGAANAITANVVDEPVLFFQSATTLTDTFASRITWGFVDP